MTENDTTEKPQVSLPPPAPADQIDPDAMYDALRHLVRTTGWVLTAVAKNSTDLHRHVKDLEVAWQEGRDLLHPPAPPAAPEGATVLYAHALRKHDQVWVDDRWLVVADVLDTSVSLRATDVVFRPLPSVNGLITGPVTFDNMRPLAVIRREVEE